jgi:hypothetical protein
VDAFLRAVCYETCTGERINENCFTIKKNTKNKLQNEITPFHPGPEAESLSLYVNTLMSVLFYRRGDKNFNYKVETLR